MPGKRKVVVVVTALLLVVMLLVPPWTCVWRFRHNSAIKYRTWTYALIVLPPERIENKTFAGEWIIDFPRLGLQIVAMLVLSGTALILTIPTPKKND